MPKPIVPTKVVPVTTSNRVSGVPAPAKAVLAKASTKTVEAVAVAPKARVYKPLLDRLSRMITFTSPRVAKLHKFVSKMKGETTEEQAVALVDLQKAAATMAIDVATVEANLAFLVDTKFKPARGARQNSKESKLVAGQPVIIKDTYYSASDYGSNGDLSIVEVGEKTVTLQHDLNSKGPQFKVPKRFVVAVQAEDEAPETEDNAEVAGDADDATDAEENVEIEDEA